MGILQDLANKIAATGALPPAAPIILSDPPPCGLGPEWKKIAENAQRLRADGMPDDLNRWLTMTPEKLAEERAALDRKIERQRNGGIEPMAKIGPREQQLRERRAEEAKRAFDPHADEHAEQKRKKVRGRIATMKAKLSGEAAKMPLTGKAAIDAIKRTDAEIESAAAYFASFGKTKPSQILIAAIDERPPEATAPAHPEESVMETQTVTTETEKKTPAKRKPASKPKGKKASAKKASARKPAKKIAAKRASTAKPKEGGVRPGSKLEIIVGLLKREEGCTTADVLASTGWPAVSMPQQAKSAGLTLRKEKTKGEPTRYFAS